MEKKETRMDTRSPLIFRRTATHSPVPGPKAGSVLIVVEQDNLVGPDLRWPLRIAKLDDADITLLLCPPEKMGKSGVNIDLSASAEQPAYERGIAERMRTVLDAYLGPEQWTSARHISPGATEESGNDSQDGRLSVQLILLDPHHLVEQIREQRRHPRFDLVLLVGGADPANREGWMDVLKTLLRATAYSVGLVVPGSRRDDGDLLVAAGRQSHGRAAIDLATELAADTGRRLTSLYVEPDIGPDAVSVGHRILDRRLQSAIGQRTPAQITKRVVVHDDPAKGIIETSQEESFELLILGATRLGALGDLQLSGVPYRVLRSRPDATLISVRKGVPFASRLKRWLEFQIQRRVPQLDREGRIKVVEQIQSNSQWNFDFILLIALAALIATMGLLDDSPAVIIGAMLVAPLMTPLLGLGLSIAQGNPRLARMTLKSASLGFLTAFVLAFAVGLLSRDFYEPTIEMESRDWPQILDLVVALVSGLAAAYAYSRPGLLAALPGVAIAAALVPPVATSGLAMSIGEYEVAIGALLLFAVNIVAIVGAAGVALWAVGIRQVVKPKSLTHLLGYALSLITIVLALALVFSPPLLAPPVELVEAVESALADDYRLRRIRLDGEHAGVGVQVDIGGSRLPDTELQQRLRDIARDHLGKDATVRLTYRFEALVK
jgi:uncharacterized hydrophobic protein (TIGR00271 family)